MSATVVDGHIDNPAAAAKEPQAAPKVPWLLAFAIGFAALFGNIAIKSYQHLYSWSVGLDSWSPEFQAYWMSIFYTQIIVIPVVGATAIAWLWFTRDRRIHELPARAELQRYYTMFGILTGVAITSSAVLGLLVEADAAWHQVVIRDTDFTPTHIFLFYTGIPAGMLGLILAWLWVHTRLPYFSGRVSVPFTLAVLGFFMVGPVVAFNEWAHTFFYAEELFGAPVHWFFVLAGFFLVFLGGFVLQCLQRMRDLTGRLRLEELEREVLKR